MRSWRVERLRWAGFLAVVFAGWLGLSGCGGGEPAGEDAYSQKFEKPAGAPEGTGVLPDQASERRQEIEKAQESKK